MSGIITQFKKKVKDLHDYIVLVVVNTKKYQDTNIELTKYLINEKSIPGVYISLNRPFEVIQKGMEKAGINTKLILFIDAVARPMNSIAERVGNCLYVGSPDRLSDISVAIEEAVNALPNHDKFIYFDSLNTLSIYNEFGTVAKFGHYLASKIRSWKIKGIFISLEKADDRALLDQFTQFCDVRVDITA